MSDRPAQPTTQPADALCGALLLAAGMVFQCDEPKGHDGVHLCPEGVTWFDVDDPRGVSGSATETTEEP